MTTAAQTGGAATSGPTEGADLRLALLTARHDQILAAIEPRAVEVVRAWLLDHDRTWLAVDFTKTRPEPPLDSEAALAAAVSRLPRRAFGNGLDVRGSFIVRLATLNAYLGREHDDRAATPTEPRIEVVIVRDPDGGTDTTLFFDGVELGPHDYEEYIVDAGRGYEYGDWIESRDWAAATASPAAAGLLRQCYDYPPGHQYIDGAPDDWPFENGDDQ